MMIPEKLKKLIDKIFFGNQSESQWLELEEEVKRYMKILSKEQLRYFEESGAGDMLSMACSGIRYSETMRSFGVVYDENGQVLDWGQLEPGETLEYDPKTQSYKRSCELNKR
jgi:hypothetical protein